MKATAVSEIIKTLLSEHVNNTTFNLYSSK